MQINDSYNRMDRSIPLIDCAAPSRQWTDPFAKGRVKMVNLIRKQVEKIAEKTLLDEVRFIDAGDFTEEHVGVPDKFKNRQPRSIMPEAKSIIIVSLYIGKFVVPRGDSGAKLSRLTLSGLSANIIKPLVPICDLLKENGYRTIVIDGARGENRLPMKATAVKAGMGWIGKNTLLINESYGSFRALGAVITDAELHGNDVAHSISKERCGSCTRCIDVCPMDALKAPRRIVRSKCISHILSIGTDAKDREGARDVNRIDTQGFIMECDICQNACPWNQKHISQPLSTSYGDRYDLSKLAPHLELDRLRSMDKDTYRHEIRPWMGNASMSHKLFMRNVSSVLRHYKTNLKP